MTVSKSFEEATDVVVIEYDDLRKSPGEIDLKAEIETAFGNEANCLGLLLVKNIPDFEKHRSKLLSSSKKFSKLPEKAKQSCQNAAAPGMLGWSHGIERMNGQLDYSKGSYYANPIFDNPYTEEELKVRPLLKEFSSFTLPNVWPSEDLPEFETNFKELGQLIFQTGCLLAAHCDDYIKSKLQDKGAASVQKSIAHSKSIKGRLLHYFSKGAEHENEKGGLDSWCGWHFDHSIITGLTSAAFTHEQDFGFNELDSTKDRSLAPFFKRTGLYIKTRGGLTKRVSIPKDCLAFQIGECLQLMSGNFLQATEHCVAGIEGCDDICRDTFAVFMQPNFEDYITGEQTFAEFTRDVLRRHY